MTVRYINPYTADFYNTMYGGRKEKNHIIPGVYINGMYSNDFVSRRIFTSWKNFVFDPSTLFAAGAVTAIKSDSWSPRELGGNFIGSLIIIFLMSILIFIIPYLLGVLFDLFVTLPRMVKNINEWENYPLTPQQQNVFKNIEKSWVSTHR